MNAIAETTRYTATYAGITFEVSGEWMDDDFGCRAVYLPGSDVDLMNVLTVRATECIEAIVAAKINQMRSIP